MEAPPGFEPGMEVLQTGPGCLSCCFALLSDQPYSPAFPGVWARLFPNCSQRRQRRNQLVARLRLQPRHALSASSTGLNAEPPASDTHTRKTRSARSSSGTLRDKPASPQRGAACYRHVGLRHDEHAVPEGPCRQGTMRIARPRGTRKSGGGLCYGFKVKCATGDGTAMANAKSFRPKRK